MRRRFDKRIYILFLDEVVCVYIFCVYVGEILNDFMDEDYYVFGVVMEGFSGFDIDYVVKDVLYEFVRKV